MIWSGWQLYGLGTAYGLSRSHLENRSAYLIRVHGEVVVFAQTLASPHPLLHVPSQTLQVDGRDPDTVRSLSRISYVFVFGCVRSISSPGAGPVWYQSRSSSDPGGEAVQSRSLRSDLAVTSSHDNAKMIPKCYPQSTPESKMI